MDALSAAKYPIEALREPSAPLAEFNLTSQKFSTQISKNSTEKILGGSIQYIQGLLRSNVCELLILGVFLFLGVIYTIFLELIVPEVPQLHKYLKIGLKIQVGIAVLLNTGFYFLARKIHHRRDLLRYLRQLEIRKDFSENGAVATDTFELLTQLDEITLGERNR